MNDFTPITIRDSVLTQTKKSVPKVSVNEGKTYRGVLQGPRLSEKQIFVIHQVHAKKLSQVLGAGARLRITVLGVAISNKRIKEKLRVILVFTLILHLFTKSSENLIL